MDSQEALVLISILFFIYIVVRDQTSVVVKALSEAISERDEKPKRKPSTDFWDNAIRMEFPYATDKEIKNTRRANGIIAVREMLIDYPYNDVEVLYEALDKLEKGLVDDWSV